MKVLQGHTGPVFALVRKGVHVLSASWDKSVIAWDAEYKSLHKEYHHHNVRAAYHILSMSNRNTLSFVRML